MKKRHLIVKCYASYSFMFVIRPIDDTKHWRRTHSRCGRSRRATWSTSRTHRTGLCHKTQQHMTNTDSESGLRRRDGWGVSTVGPIGPEISSKDDIRTVNQLVKQEIWLEHQIWTDLKHGEETIMWNRVIACVWKWLSLIK